MCSTTAGPMPGSGPAGLLSQAPGRGAVHAGAGPAPARLAAAAAARRDRGGDRPERLSSAHITFIDEAEAPEAMRAARLADPRRNPISLVQPRLYATSTISSPRSPAASARRSARSGRRLARGWSSGRCAAPRSAGRMGCDVALLPGHRQPQMGPALSDPRFFDRIGETMGDSCCCSSPAATAVPIAGALNVIGPTRSTAAIGAAIDGGAVPAFRAQLLSGDRMGDRSWLQSVQAGAQGEHKLARGYEPVITKSAHFIPNPGFRARSPIS
jgi:uncharacterized protein